jgi:hypothetical protein
VSELHAPSEHSVLPVGQLAAQAPWLQTPVAGHFAQVDPQCMTFEAAQAPSHETSPEAHTHMLFLQVVPTEAPVPQVFPHWPQFWLSLVSSTHPLEQSVRPAVHVRAAPPSPPSGPLPKPLLVWEQFTPNENAKKAPTTKVKTAERFPNMFKTPSKLRESLTGRAKDAREKPVCWRARGAGTRMRPPMRIGSRLTVVAARNRGGRTHPRLKRPTRPRGKSPKGWRPA